MADRSVVLTPLIAEHKISNIATIDMHPETKNFILKLRAKPEMLAKEVVDAPEDRQKQDHTLIYDEKSGHYRIVDSDGEMGEPVLTFSTTTERGNPVHGISFHGVPYFNVEYVLSRYEELKNKVFTKKVGSEMGIYGSHVKSEEQNRIERNRLIGISFAVGPFGGSLSPYGISAYDYYDPYYYPSPSYVPLYRGGYPVWGFGGRRGSRPYHHNHGPHSRAPVRRVGTLSHDELKEQKKQHQLQVMQQNEEQSVRALKSGVDLKHKSNPEKVGFFLVDDVLLMSAATTAAPIVAPAVLVAGAAGAAGATALYLKKKKKLAKEREDLLQ